MHLRGNDGGFTLLEVLVATAIFASLIAALHRGIATGAHGLRMATAEDTAITLLRRQLASGGIETPLTAATASGTTPEGLRWERVIRPYEIGSAPAEGETYRGYWVSVTVRWREKFGAERSLNATTLRIARST